MNFVGQHVVITGASRGIGYATSARIVSLGGRVSMIARRMDLLAEEAAKLGSLASWFAADVGDQGQLIGTLEAAIAQNGPIDGLFLNAAAPGTYATTPEYTDQAFEEVMRVNVHSPFWAARHVLPGMMARGRGSILVTGSLGGETGMSGNIGYCISKHAITGLARCIAMEAAPAGVRCNCLAPGFINTDMLAGSPDSFKQTMANRVPQGRLGRPEEAAAVATFLLSDEASHVTAQSWAVDGGLLGTLMI